MFAALLLTLAQLSQMAVVTGNIYAMQISLCLDKKDAVAILDAEKTLSHEHASKLFDALDGCVNVPTQFRVGPVVHTITNAAGKTYRVIEISSPTDAAQKLYWMTSMRVVAGVTKPGAPANEISQPIDMRPT